VGQALVQGDDARGRRPGAAAGRHLSAPFYMELQRAGRADDEAHVVAQCNWRLG
jgi:DNA polymerase-3 subunit alpha